MSMDISTPTMTGMKVDWRNYDYSEGPPKATAAVTRDTNPYSQRIDYPLTRRTLSNTTELKTRTNNTDSFRLNSSVAGLGNCKSFDGPSDNYSMRVETNVDMSASSTLKAETPSSSKDENKFIMKNYRNGLTPIDRDSIGSVSSLTYRPAKAISKPVEDLEPDEEDKMMRLPKVKKYAENLDEDNVALAEDLSDKRITGVKPTPAHAMTHSPDMIDEYQPNVVTPTNQLDGRPKKTFQKVWEEAEKDLEEAATSSVRQQVVSDDEEHYNYNSGHNDGQSNQNNHGVVKSISHNNIYDNINRNEGNEENDDKFDDVEFDDFAGDRNESNLVHDDCNKENPENDNSSEASVGKMDVGKIDVPMNLPPVGILKNTGRFDAFTKSCAASITSMGSIGSNNSFGSRMKSLGSVCSDNNDVSRDASSKKDSNANDTVANTNSESAVRDITSKEEDDDTIFQFEKQDVKKRYRRRRSRSKGGRIEDEDDDTSIDDNGRSPIKNRADTLRDRTKQAWSVRNRATAASVTNSGTIVERRERVSFQNDATIREFTPESDEEDSTILAESDEDTEYTEYTEYTENTATSEDYDDDTYAGRSMHSYYSKSNESEAEDMIKDFLLIGRGEATNPGQRQLKYKRGRKEAYKKLKQEQNRDDSLSTITSSTKEKKVGVEDDAVSMFYSLCEDGISAIGDVCGLFSSVDENVNEKKQADEVTSDEWLQTTSKAVFYADHDVKPDNLCGSSDPSLSADNGKDALLKMALNAARLKHSLRNLKYDETQSMNVKKDVKVVELRVGIPIGVGFEESAYGCAVKKIFKNGNTFNNSRGDKIEVGDHLASINGITAFSKGITDLCKILAACPDPEEIHLFFFRYIGPIRASNANEQQGYEVIDPHVEKPKDWPKDELSPVKLHKSLSSVGCIKSALKKPSDKSSEQAVKQDVEDVNQDTEKENIALPISKENKGSKSQKSDDAQKVKQKKNSSGNVKKKRGFGFFRRRKEGATKDTMSQPKTISK